MKKTIDSGLRRHRPKKFRFEYIPGRYSGMNKEKLYWRRFSEIEREEDGFKWMQELLKDYWQNIKQPAG